MVELRLPSTLRRRLKRPLGQLITGSARQCMRKLRLVLEEENPTKLILVGDVVSRNAHKYGLKPHLRILDGREMRRASRTKVWDHSRVRTVQNKAGTVSAAAWGAIRASLRGRVRTLKVDGEEDLLALPAVLISPLGSVVVYGQPGLGVVILRATEDKKRWVRRLLNRFEKGAR